MKTTPHITRLIAMLILMALVIFQTGCALPGPGKRPTSLGTVTNLEVWFRPSNDPRRAGGLAFYRFRTSSGDFILRPYMEDAKTLQDEIARIFKLQTVDGKPPLLVLDTWELDAPDGKSIETLEGQAAFYSYNNKHSPNDLRERYVTYPASCRGWGFMSKFEMTPADQLVVSIPLNLNGLGRVARSVERSTGGPGLIWP